MTENYLYGLPGSEYMQNDPVGIYEQWADDNGYDPDRHSDAAAAAVVLPWRLTIEEWSSAPADIMSHHDIIEHIAESFADDAVFEEASDAVDEACNREDVQEAFKAARDLLQSRVTGWRYADRLIRNLTITWDAAGNPLLDGVPLYPKVEP